MKYNFRLCSLHPLLLITQKNHHRKRCLHAQDIDFSFSIVPSPEKKTSAATVILSSTFF